MTHARGPRCDEVASLLVEFHEGELDPRLDAAVAEHLYHCDACAEAQRQLREIDEVVSTHRRNAESRAANTTKSFVRDTQARMSERRSLETGSLQITSRWWASRAVVSAAAAILTIGFVVFVVPPKAKNLFGVEPIFKTAKFPSAAPNSIHSGNGILSSGRLMGTGGVAGLELPFAPTDHAAQMAKIIASSRR